MFEATGADSQQGAEKKEEGKEKALHLVDLHSGLDEMQDLLPVQQPALDGNLFEVEEDASKPFSLRNPPRPLEVHVTGNKEAMAAGKPFTQYEVTVRWGKVQWKVLRRFSEFDELHKVLILKTTRMPRLPAKTWVRTLEANFVARRQRELDNYVQELLKLPHFHFPELAKFLQYHQHVVLPAASYLPVQTRPLAHEFGLNDFHFDPQKRVLFAACQDVGVLSRVDSFVSNIRLPWEEKHRFVPVGSVNIWKQASNGSWFHILEHYFDTPASSVTFDNLRDYLFLGLGTGHVLIYFVDFEAKTLSLIQDLEIHMDRVTALMYEKERDVLMTCGRDKLFNVYDVKNHDLKCTGQLGKAWLSSLAFDSQNGVAFVGSFSKEVFCVSIKGQTPQIQHTLVGHEGSVRCLSFNAKERYLMSGGFDKSVGVWHVGRPGELHRARSVGWMTGGPDKKIKAVTFAPKFNFVIAGYESGHLAIFDAAEEGRLLYVWLAHVKDVFRLHWEEDERLLLSCSHDGTVKFWSFDKHGALNRAVRKAVEEKEEE